MTPTIAQAILIAVAVLALLFLVHRFAPNSVVGKAEGQLLAEVEKAPSVVQIESFVRDEAMQALTTAEAWLTDTSTEQQAIAKANASMASKQRALRDHVDKLSAHLPANIPSA